MTNQKKSSKDIFPPKKNWTFLSSKIGPSKIGPFFPLPSLGLVFEKRVENFLVYFARCSLLALILFAISLKSFCQ